MHISMKRHNKIDFITYNHGDNKIDAILGYGLHSLEAQIQHSYEIIKKGTLSIKYQGMKLKFLSSDGFCNY